MYVCVCYCIQADVAEKVQWLRDNDDLAKQIAYNARVFASSYLRLEDHYCYIASALYTLGKIINGSTATLPFTPYNLFDEGTESYTLLPPPPPPPPPLLPPAGGRSKEGIQMETQSSVLYVLIGIGCLVLSLCICRIFVAIK